MTTPNTTVPSLYERLGGTDGIAKLVDDIVEAHMENPTIKARFLPYKEDPDVLEPIKRNIRDFFVQGSGGPEVYEGQNMTEAHKGMNIDEKEYVAAIDDILDVMNNHGLGQKEKDEVLAILYSMKEEIMRV